MPATYCRARHHQLQILKLLRLSPDLPHRPARYKLPFDTFTQRTWGFARLNVLHSLGHDHTRSRQQQQQCSANSGVCRADEHGGGRGAYILRREGGDVGHDGRDLLGSRSMGTWRTTLKAETSSICAITAPRLVVPSTSSLRPSGGTCGQ